MIITIDPEIEALIPSLKYEEQSKLRESIKAEGCRDPLVIWKDHNILLDGHNRHAICQELGIQFKTVELDFSDKDRAKLWVLKNQLGRRNLSDFQFKLLVGQEYELEKKLYGGDRKSEAFQESSGQSDHMNSEPWNANDPNLTPEGYSRTCENIAKEHGISEKTVRRSADLYKTVEAIKEVAPEVAQKLESEEIKVPDKDLRAVGKVLQKNDDDCTPNERAHKEHVISELKEDLKKATETAKEIAVQTHTNNSQPLPDDLKKSLDDYFKTLGTKPAIPIEWSNSGNHSIILVIAPKTTCPKCGKAAIEVLRWGCCNLSLEEATDLAEEIMDQKIEQGCQKTIARRQKDGYL
jgi:hypothetical protein